jgi:glycosyltransferase involved in cell wall biosynthesis
MTAEYAPAGRRARRKRALAIAHSPPAFERATQLLGERDNVRVITSGRGWQGALRAARAILRARPRLVYLVDIGLGTTAAAMVARLVRARVVVDTGDVAFELARSTGSRSRLGLAAVWLGERLTLASASHVVVRGSAHLPLIRGRPATFAPDLAPSTAQPVSGTRVRSRLGLEGRFVVGLVGSYVPAPRLGTSYGWDLIEALPATPPHVAALMVGDGGARPALEARAAELGVADRCRFVGPVPPAEVAEWVGAMDVAISTQTNDLVGAVRTTGKLPLYLACGCPVLASHVGEAARLLGPLGWTIPYDGVVDRGYPARLAKALSRWVADPTGAPERRRQALELSAKAFDRAQIRRRVLDVVDGVLAADA